MIDLGTRRIPVGRGDDYVRYAISTRISNRLKEYEGEKLTPDLQMAVRQTVQTELAHIEDVAWNWMSQEQLAELHRWIEGFKVTIS